MANRRVAELQLARARAALLSTHAHLIQDISSRLSDRMPTVRLVRHYSHAHALSELEEAWLRIQAVAHVGTGRTPYAVASDGRRHGDGAWKMLLEEIRAGVAPFADHPLQDRLAYEFAGARAVVLKVHVRHAMTLAHALQSDLSAPAAVAWYVREMDVPRDISGAVYALAVAQLNSAAGHGVLPALLKVGTTPGDGIDDSTPAAEVRPATGDMRS